MEINIGKFNIATIAAKKVFAPTTLGIQWNRGQLRFAFVWVHIVILWNV